LQPKLIKEDIDPPKKRKSSRISKLKGHWVVLGDDIKII